MKLPGTGRRRAIAEADVAVVGGGVPALVTAIELSRRGASVIVAGGVEADTPAHGLGLALLGPGRPYLDVANRIGRAAAQLVWAAGCENQLRLKAFVDAAGDVGYRAGGSFLLARTRAQAEALAESEDMLRDDGFPGEFLDHYMLETRFDVAGFPAAYWAAGDAELDGEALRDAARRAAGAGGVAFRPGRVRAVHVEPSGVRVELEAGSLRATAAVVATDAGAAELVPDVASLLHRAGSARLTLAPLAGAALPSALRTADGRIAWQSRGASVVFGETGAAAGAPGEEPLQEFAALLPFDLRPQRLDEEGVDLTPDGLPVVGKLPGRPLALACGFAGLASGFAFAAARWVADALLRGTDPTPDALRATRVPLL